MSIETVKVEGVVSTAIGRYAEIADLIKTLEAEQKAIKSLLATAHKNTDATTFLNEEGHRSAVIAATVRIGVDADRLAKEMPEVFKQYAKETVIGESIRVTPAKKVAAPATLGENFVTEEAEAKRVADLAALRAALAAA